MVKFLERLGLWQFQVVRIHTQILTLKNVLKETAPEVMCGRLRVTFTFLDVVQKRARFVLAVFILCHCYVPCQWFFQVMHPRK